MESQDVLTLTPYFNMINKRSKSEQEAIRLQVVRYAQQHSIKAAQRKFGCSKNTVREWKRRFEKEGRSGLINRSRAPKHIPHKTSSEEEARIIECRLEAPCYGPKRLKWFYEINRSECAVKRILQQNGLTKKEERSITRKTIYGRLKRNIKPSHITRKMLNI